MMADALGHPVIPCLEKEASGRGAALMALERLGAIQHIGEPALETGPAVTPVAANRPIYDELLRKQRRLYTKLFEEN
jgi:gluconokinase